MSSEEKSEKPGTAGNPDIGIDVYIQKAIAGDEKAFRYLYQLHSARMYSLCKRYAGTPPDADDLFQEGYIKMFRSLHSYKGQGSFEGWVRKIFVNTCLDCLKTKNYLDFHADLGQVTENHPFVDGEKAINLSNEELLQIIRRMPVGYRTIVNLFLIEGYNHKEIADMLKISEGTSKSQLSKAKQKLQEIILKNNGG